MTDLVIYHGNCPDGFCAAFIASKKFPDSELVPATYGHPPPNVHGRDVLMVDFSYPRAVMLDMRDAATNLQVLDHHKTAEVELQRLDFATFDMNRSGAALTWDTLFPNQTRPWYVDYVQDRDLWRWALPNSKDVSAYIMALPHDLDEWAILDSIPLDLVMLSGKSIRAHIRGYVANIVAQKRRGKLSGFTTDVVNAAYTNISDVCDELCNSGAEIGCGWFERGDGQMQFSLRSRGDVDVSAIAKEHGGGGHKNASGFQMPFTQGRYLLDLILDR